MALTNIPRNYNLPDADLCMFTSNLCNTMTRDLTDLTAFGITALKITALKALGDAFEIFPSDEVLLAYVIAATETKTAKAELVKESIRNMITRCQIKWGVDSWQEKSLAVKGMNQFTDDSLLTASRRVVAQMTEFLTDLADTGLTQVMLDEMEDLNEEYETAKNEQFTKSAERDNKTEERIKKGNELYSFVSTYCEIGKRVYANSDPAKYNDYIIYGTVTPVVLTAPSNFNWSVNTYLFTWDSVVNATSYQIEMSTNGIDWSELWTGAETSFNYHPETSGTFYFRCRARNSGGYGPYCNSIEVVYFTQLPAPANFIVEASIANPLEIRISWNPVETAQWYNLFKSEVPLGAPVGPWLNQGQQTETLVVQTGRSGKRFYYKVQGANPMQEGDFTSDLFVDIN
ncbi:MAG: hypothetical protein A2X64_09930 [Ignavibacteria bacterium GWF2_33_9]|nr:MAG: hypothetical protein A2X64_09930 [Ignavibacteria bacterium GWF2_33_9]